MICIISWEEILEIWKNELWPGRESPIEPTSAMLYLKGYSMENMDFVPTFFGHFENSKLVGVNSGHGCVDGLYRSRGLWVDKSYRGCGIGQQLLTATIVAGKDQGFNGCWSYPRKTSWSTYKAVGFKKTSKWQVSETSDSNAYCLIHF